MIVEIPKGTKPDKVKKMITAKSIKRTKKNINSFFGKLPKIEAGLAFQKRVRNEWE